jgi:hypothetical protein
MVTRALLLAGLFACATPPLTGPLSAPALMAHVAALADPALDGRGAATPGERAAARYAADQLRAAGLEPIDQPVPFRSGSVNVHALLAGSTDEVIVIGAHLDHLDRQGGALHPGADDDGSGVALVLGIARTLAARRAELGRSVLFVLFGAEEPGLVGSRYFVAHPPVPRARIAGMVNLDMIGRPLLDQPLYRLPLHLVGIRRGRAVGIVGTRYFPGLRALADAAFTAEGGELVAAEDLPAEIEAIVERDAEGRSDSWSFEQQGIPALFFGDGESADYHQPGDTIARLHPALLAQNARAVARVVIALSNAPAAAFARSAAVPPRRTPASGWYLPLGFSNALSIRSKLGYVYGGEVSLARLWSGPLSYAGLYADALRDRGTTRFSFGPELGKRWYGVDAGYAIALGEAIDDRGLPPGGSGAEGRRGLIDHGVVVRPFATLSVVSVGLRLGYLRHDGAFAELGLLIKYPLAMVTRSTP